MERRSKVWECIRKAGITVLAAVCILSMGMTAGAAKNKFVKKSGKTYYYDAKGRKVSGLKKIKGKMYFFEKNGVRFQKGWKTVKGKKYYFSKKNGAAYTGFRKVDGKGCLFAKNGKRYGSGLITYDGKVYWIKGGSVQYGWKNLKGNRYYFSKADGAAVTGWQTVDEKEYYFNNKGAMQKNQWIGDRYVGSKGYVTKKKPGSTEKPNAPAQNPDPVQPPAETSAVQEPSGKHEIFYNEAYSDQIFEEINRFRVSQGCKPLQRAKGTLLIMSILRGAYNVDVGLETRSGSELAAHGGGQIGLGGFCSSAFMYPEYNKLAQGIYSGAVSDWINSPLHNANMRWDMDYMSVAFMHSEADPWGHDYVSVVVTFGTQGTEHYFIDGKDMGSYDPDTAPLYGFTIRYTQWDVSTQSYIPKDVYYPIEDTVKGLGVPCEKWDGYLNSYKTVR